MKKLAAIGLGVALTAAILTTSPQPAKADPALLILGAIVVGAVIAGAHHPTLQTVPPFSWAHKHWCQSHYKTYDPKTNLFIHKSGQRRNCIPR
jgi:hypothetical protein